MSNPCLYVFVNTDLESMNWGKSMAQSSHASNAFIDKYYIGETEIDQLVFDWVASTKQGFGTQSNLKSNNFYSDMKEIGLWAKENGYPYDVVNDPTYPFEVSAEVARLLRDTDVEVVKIKNDGRVLCVRSEDTAFYIFGDRDDEKFRDYMRQWKLHP